ncbi:MAG: hypothetical protein MUE90_06380 [Thermoanaerobaculales bacterium]|jgi:hypothetical protein|nr:hypothetical protein [Thermoanaerobaculales bacterium]
MEAWEAGWEIGFPAQSVEELLLALVVRDLVHGSSYDVEATESGAELALDFLAGDELEGDTYQLLLTAEVSGTEDRDLVASFAEEMLEGLVDEAQELVAQSEALGSRPLSELEFRAVPEDEERWDLVVPDWLAPEDAVVPFGFRAFLGAAGAPWPDDRLLDGHGRVVLVPFGGRAHAFGVPAPAEPGEGDEGDGGDTLPLHPGG